jgi:mannonate dehydratase
VLGILAALGVTTICSRLPSAKLVEQWSVEGLTRLRERVEKFGITLDMVPLPMSSNPIARAENPNILLGKSPERDKEIDDICQMIRNASRAGIPSLKYNLTLLGVPRTENTPGVAGPATARSCTTRRNRIRHSPRQASSGRTCTGNASRIFSIV